MTKREGAPKGRQRLLVAAMAVCAVVLVFSVVQIVRIGMAYADSSAEYDALRAAYAPAAAGEGAQPGAAARQAAAALPEDPATLNPDYAGWLEVPGTAISYPVVRGQDNERYLNTSFSGARSALGAIFMDYCCAADFSSLHTVVYGHNVKNGSMFGGLPRFLDAGYRAEHPTILVTEGETTCRYRVVSAQKTTVDDPAYRLSFADEADFAAFAQGLGAPRGASRLLTLSTCSNGPDQERVLVHAVPEE